MRYSSRRKKKYIIIGLCLVLVLMMVGYAAFSTVLTINSSSEITSNWDVEITGVRAVNDSSLTYNDAYDKVEPAISNNKLSVTIQTGLLSPGDTRIYEIEVSNLGNLDSEVTTSFQNKINDSTLFSYDGVSPVGSDGKDILSVGGSYDSSLLETEEPFFMPAFTNNKRYIYLTIKYKDSVTSQPKDLNPSVTLSISATQKTHNSAIVSSGVETVTVGGLEIPIVTSGDGLYYDDYADEYYYRGANPDNYISFNNEVWRIMSIDNNKNIKIIKDERIDLTGYSGVNPSNSKQGRFDGDGFRTSGYCSLGSAPTNGCNVWALTSNMVGSPPTFTNGSYSGIVTADAELNTYLNGTYKAILQASKDWKYVKTGMTWNVGPAGWIFASTNNEITTYKGDANSVSALQSLEGDFHWIGDIALITESEYIKANSNSSCLTNSTLATNASTDNCRTTNYLYNSYWYWLLSPLSGSPSSVLAATPAGFVGTNSAHATGGSVRPSLFLKSNITLSGTGTNDENIFTIS